MTFRSSIPYISVHRPVPDGYCPTSCPGCCGDPFLPHSPHLLPVEITSSRKSHAFPSFFVYTFHPPKFIAQQHTLVNAWMVSVELLTRHSKALWIRAAILYSQTGIVTNSTAGKIRNQSGTVQQWSAVPSRCIWWAPWFRSSGRTSGSG